MTRSLVLASFFFFFYPHSVATGDKIARLVGELVHNGDVKTDRNCGVLPRLCRAACEVCRKKYLRTISIRALTSDTDKVRLKAVCRLQLERLGG